VRRRAARIPRAAILVPVTGRDVRSLRLRNQYLTVPPLETVAEVVRWLGAVQSQGERAGGNILLVDGWVVGGGGAPSTETRCVEVRPLVALDGPAAEGLARAADIYGSFLGLPAAPSFADGLLQAPAGPRESSLRGRPLDKTQPATIAT
jgi:hypothetical protein